MERSREKSYTIQISQLENRLTFHSSEEILVKPPHKNESLNLNSSSSSLQKKKISKIKGILPIFRKNLSLKKKHSLSILEKPIESSSISVPALPKHNKPHPKSEPSEKNSEAFKGQSELHFAQEEIKKLQKECLVLEERAKKYEDKYYSLMKKTNDLEQENKFLEVRLKDALRDLKSVNTVKKEEGSLALLSDPPKKVDFEFYPKTETGKYLLGLTKKYDQQSARFLIEIERLIEYKEYKLNSSIQHYKKIIENLNNKIKLKNLNALSTFKINELGQFFSDCVSEVKKEFSLGSSQKFCKGHKKKLLEMFLLNENVLKIIHNNLIEYTRLSPQHKISEPDPSMPIHDEKQFLKLL